MATTIEVAPGVRFAADVLAPGWIRIASGQPDPAHPAHSAKTTPDGRAAGSTPEFAGSHPISVLEQLDLL